MFSGLTVASKTFLQSVIKSSIDVYTVVLLVHVFIFSICVKPIFCCQSFHWRNPLQALWPLKGWFEFTATGRDAVQVEAGGEENAHRLRKGRRKWWKFVGKSENPAKTCLILTAL